MIGYGGMGYGMGMGGYGQGNGWQRAGGALGGAMSGQTQAIAYQRGALMGTEQANLLQMARKNRTQNLAHEAITPGLVHRAQAGDPDAQAQLLSLSSQAGINPAEFATASRTYQQTGQSAQAWNLAQDPNADLNHLNRDMIVIGGKPVALTRVSDGTAYNAMVAPNSPQQSMAPTAVGAADIMLRGAQAGAANASAGKSNAEAARATAGIGTDKMHIVDGPNGPMVVNLRNPSAAAIPVTGPDGKPIGNKASTGGITAPTATDFQSIGAVNPITGKVDPAKAQAFMAWQSQQSATDPQMANTAYALRKFSALQRAPVGTPGAPGASVAVAPNIAPVGTNPGQVGTQGTIFDPNSLAAKMAGTLPAAPAAPAPAAPSLAGAMSGNAGPAPLHVIPAAAAAPPSAPAGPPSPIKGVARASNGAYTPTSQAQYDALPVGAVYMRPGEAMRRTKGDR